MNNSNTIMSNRGILLYLNPNYKVKQHETCYLIYGATMTPIMVPCNLDNTISEKTMDFLLKKGILSREKSNIFSQPALCKSIFSWDFSEELNFLLDFINQNSAHTVLDVGCGYGRLLIPMYQKNIDIWGIDSSLPLVEDLNNTLNIKGLPRAFCVDMTNFALPNAFDIAFAAMNTLRYLEDLNAIRRHLQMMASTVRKNGYYLFQIMISHKPTEDYYHQWGFEYQSKQYICEWKYHSFCHLLNQIMDEVTIYSNGSSKDVVIREFQKQAYFSFKTLEVMLEDLKPHWEYYQMIDPNWQTCSLEKCVSSHEDKGNYWVILKRK